MDDHEDSLHRARQAYAAQDWRGAAYSFDAVAPHRLTADDLAVYADALWWLGRVEDVPGDGDSFLDGTDSGTGNDNCDGSGGDRHRRVVRVGNGRAVTAVSALRRTSPVIK